MKKQLMTLAVFAATITMASASSFSWASATAVSFNGTKLKSDATVTGYLLFLGSGASLDSTYTLTKDSTLSSIESSIGTEAATQNKTTALSKLQGSYSFSFEGGAQKNGDTFAMLLVYTGAADGKTYYNLSSTVYTLEGLADDTSAGSAASFAFSYDKVGESSSLSKGGGWTTTPVPEPSTAMLALAGLALLIRRRKA